MSEGLITNFTEGTGSTGWTIAVPKQIVWEPKEDITAYELACSMEILMCTDPLFKEHLFKTTTYNVQRHFRVVIANNGT